VVYPDLWPGVDLAFRGESGQLKYEFVLRPGAKVEDIRLAYAGAEGLSLDGAGNLLIHTPLGPLTDTRPVSYQVIDGNRSPVASRFVLGGSAGGAPSYGFALGAGYDPRRPLVIDPGLLYSTYLGGSGFDQGRGIAVDATGSAYVTGETDSADFPTTPGAFDTTFNGFVDAFVTKLDAMGAPAPECTITGTQGNDRVEGTSGPDVICGLGGDDHIRGLPGNDVIRAGPGDDVAIGGVGDDRLRGHGGRDFLRGDFPDHRPGADRLFGGDGPDRLVTADGVGGNDTADGGAGKDRCSVDQGDQISRCP
jgi:Ca2+-binding RTX toxin-like protein